MKQIILTISLILIFLIFLKCTPSFSTIKYDCTYSKNEIVESESEAIEVANYFLEQDSTTNYYKDSVSVSINEDGNYSVSFKVKDRIIPDNIMLIVRKNDGCVAIMMLE